MSGPEFFLAAFAFLAVETVRAAWSLCRDRRQP